MLLQPTANSTQTGNDWIFDPTIDVTEYEGFIYLITNQVSGRKYIGKKTLWSRRKGKSTVESDWKTYFGSSKELLEDIKLLGEAAFRREVLHFCYTKTDMTYLETYEQFVRNVLGETMPDGTRLYYNGSIMGKFFKAPGSITQRRPHKVVKPKVKIGVRLKKQIQKHTGTQKQIAEEFGISVYQVAKIKGESST